MVSERRNTTFPPTQIERSKNKFQKEKMYGDTELDERFTE
jgi:hypothetical protein